MRTYESCPICGAKPHMIQIHDCIFVECPDCEAADSLARWCEENTTLPLSATHTIEQALSAWSEMCAAYYAAHTTAAA